MILKEAIYQLKTLEPEHTIWIEKGKKWEANSSVVVLPEKDQGGPPDDLSGFEYFLEVFIAKEFIEDYLKGQELNDRNIIESTNRIIRYAINDA